MHINVGRLAEGVCGSPVMHDECLAGSESDGDVIGLFSWSDQNIIENLFVSVMDEIVADGWVQQLKFLLEICDRRLFAIESSEAFAHLRYCYIENV